MPWNTPKTDWEPDEIVTADDMNDIGENLATLRTPETQISDVDHATNFTTSNTSFTNVDSDANIATNQLGLRLISTGGALLVTFTGSITQSNITDTAVYFDLTLDGARVAGDDGILRVTVRSNEARNVSFVYWLDNVSAGQHDIYLQWKVEGSTATMWAGAGTSGADVHPQFTVREVS